jgi:hypothetical protein
MLTTSFANKLNKFTDGGIISPMDHLRWTISDGASHLLMDNLYLPMVNWLTIGTDGQCFGGLPYAIAIMLTTSFANRLSIFTDGGFISPSVPMDNLYLPMVNWLTIGTDCFGGLPYAITIMLTTSFANRLNKFTDGGFISPSVPTDKLYSQMVN